MNHFSRMLIIENKRLRNTVDELQQREHARISKYESEIEAAYDTVYGSVPWNDLIIVHAMAYQNNGEPFRITQEEIHARNRIRTWLESYKPSDDDGDPADIERPQL